MELSEEVKDVLVKMNFRPLRGGDDWVEYYNDIVTLRISKNGKLLYVSGKDIFDQNYDSHFGMMLSDPTMKSLLDMCVQALVKLLECFPPKNETEEDKE